MSEPDELVREILDLIEDHGCDISRKEVRTKETRGHWNLEIKLVIKPLVDEEM